MNAFETFGLQADTNIDLSALASRYRDLQSTVHPDRFANATDVEQRIAMARAVEINDAYNTLKDPVRRAMHLLSLTGHRSWPQVTRQCRWTS